MRFHFTNSFRRRPSHHHTFCCWSAGFYTFIFQSHRSNKLVVHGYRFISCIASSKSKHLYALEWSLYLSSQLPVTKNFPKCNLSFLACIFMCYNYILFIQTFFKREGWFIFVRVSAVVGSKAKHPRKTWSYDRWPKVFLVNIRILSRFLIICKESLPREGCWGARLIQITGPIDMNI